jgi:serine/threonine protein kinase
MTALAPETKLDHYEVLGLLGAGGMGEVYRARDPALKREVAIKVLPYLASSDSSRLSRFEQEARAAAALNHPNILAVYAELCGFTLARAHARTGESALISGYLGKSDTLDKAIAAFSVAYADQSEKDHAVLMQAVRKGDSDVVTEPE